VAPINVGYTPMKLRKGGTTMPDTKRMTAAEVVGYRRILFHVIAGRAKA
jgi:hypothetical protein